MKNFLRLFCMVMVLALGLCSGALAIEQSEIEGVWDVDMKPFLVAMELPEEELDALLELLGMSITIAFTPDQQMIMQTVVGGEVTQEKLTYTLEGEKILMSDGSESQLVREEDTLTIIEPNGFSMALTWHGPVEDFVILSQEEVVIDSEIVGVWAMDMHAIVAMAGMDLAGMSEEEAAEIEALLLMMSATMEFTVDGRIIMSTTMWGETDVVEYSYELQGNQIIMDGMNGQPMDFVIEGDTLILTEGEMTLTLTRVQPVEEAPAA